MKKVVHGGVVVSSARKIGIPLFRSTAGGAFPGAPACRFWFPLFCPCCLLVWYTFWFSSSQLFLRACTTHVHSRRAAIIIEYLQTAAETVARDSVGEDVNLRSHFSSEQFERLPWQRISAVEVDRSDLAQ